MPQVEVLVFYYYVHRGTSTDSLEGLSIGACKYLNLHYYHKCGEVTTTLNSGSVWEKIVSQVIRQALCTIFQALFEFGARDRGPALGAD